MTPIKCSHPAIHILTLLVVIVSLMTAVQAQEQVPPDAPTTVYLPLVIRASTETSQPADPDQATGLSVDTEDRDKVKQFFADHYQSYHDLDHYELADWNGNIDTCDPGSTSQEFRTHTLHRLNFFRAMAGVPAHVILNDDYTRKAQAAALIMSANGQRSHTPPTTWQCYTATGSEGALASNLFTGRAGIFAVDGYIEDAGTSNKDTGHRWWNLSPYLGQIGVGAVLPDSGGIADALYISDSSNRNPTTLRTYVAWPPPGFVPYQVVYTRWSFTLFSDKPFTEDMTNAVVSMETNGQPVPVEIIYNGTGMFNNHLVWVPLGRDTENSDAPWPRPDTDTTYTVTIQNVLVDGTPRTFTYEVTVFDPNT
jgi:uncharacterized protein YkwD